MKKKAVRAIMCGIVQGVGYRHYCSQAAQRLKVGGYVTNLGDGSVETEAHGEAGAVDKYITEITGKGKGFEVHSYTVDTVEFSRKHEGFTIRR